VTGFVVGSIISTHTGAHRFNTAYQLHLQLAFSEPYLPRQRALFGMCRLSIWGNSASGATDEDPAMSVHPSARRPVATTRPAARKLGYKSKKPAPPVSGLSEKLRRVRFSRFISIPGRLITSTANRDAQTVGPAASRSVGGRPVASSAWFALAMGGGCARSTRTAPGGGWLYWWGVRRRDKRKQGLAGAWFRRAVQNFPRSVGPLYGRGHGLRRAWTTTTFSGLVFGLEVHGLSTSHSWYVIIHSPLHGLSTRRRQ